jgi:hypothetical protein
MDVTSITRMVSSLKAAMEIGQTILNLRSASDLQAQAVALNTQILNALASALDAKAECLDLLEAKADLQKELRELKKQIRTRQNVEFRDNVYWLRKDRALDEGPFCPRCLGRPNQVIVTRMTRMTNPDNEVYWRCPVCDYMINKPGQSTPLE